MGRLDTFADMTGSMNQVDINEQNILQVIDELNRNADQLDAVANALSIIGRGSVNGTWSGNGGTGNLLSLTATHGFQTAPIFMASFTRSDMPNQWFNIPQWFYDNSGNLAGRAYAYTDAQNINFNFIGNNASPVSPVNMTFSWYIIQQPAQVPTGA